MEGDCPGEAQLFYESYLAGGEEYEIDGCPGTVKLNYKDGVAMCPVGQGKVSGSRKMTDQLHRLQEKEWEER